MRRSAVFVMFMVGVAACKHVERPTSPSRSTVEPYVNDSPPQFLGANSPSFAGRWTGRYQRASCRPEGTPACTRDTYPFPEPMRMVLDQTGADLTGTFVYARGGSTEYPIKGYVTAASGVAATILLPSGSRVILRFDRVGATLIGSFFLETWDSSLLVQARRFDIVTPLTREP